MLLELLLEVAKYGAEEIGTGHTVECFVARF